MLERNLEKKRSTTSLEALGGGIIEAPMEKNNSRVVKLHDGALVWHGSWYSDVRCAK